MPRVQPDHSSQPDGQIMGNKARRNTYGDMESNGVPMGSAIRQIRDIECHRVPWVDLEDPGEIHRTSRSLPTNPPGIGAGRHRPASEPNLLDYVLPIWLTMMQPLAR